MSTRSIIASEGTDGSVMAVYCHWDGYPSYNGKILLEKYNTSEKVAKLLKPGDMSSLDEKCSKPKGHSFDNRVEGYTVYYGRDRGEKNVGTKVFDSVKGLDEMDYGQYYEYLFRDAKWFFRETGGKWKVLTPKDCEDKC